MNNELQQLRHVVQALAVPVRGQVHLVQDDCSRVEMLSHAFTASRRAVQVERSNSLSPAQIVSLARLDDQLAQIRQDSLTPFCSEISLRNSPEWRRVRTMARKTLVNFGWELEMPPQEAIGRELYLN